MNQPYISAVFYYYNDKKPHWICRVEGGWDGDKHFHAKGFGCCRYIALARATRQFKQRANLT